MLDNVTQETSLSREGTEWPNRESEEMRDKAAFCVTRGSQEAGML